MMDGLECVFCQKYQTLQRTHVGGEIVKFLIQQLQPAQDSASNKFGDIFGPESLSVDGSLLFPLCSECHSFYDKLCVIYKSVQELRSELQSLLGAMQGKIGVNKSQGGKSGSEHVGYRRFRGEIAQINLSESKEMFKSLINLQDVFHDEVLKVKEEIEIEGETGFDSDEDDDRSVHFIIEPTLDDIQEQNSSSSDNTTEKARKCKSRKRRRDSDESDPDFSPTFQGTSPKKNKDGISREHDEAQDEEYEEVPPSNQSIPIPLVKPPDINHSQWCEICGQTFAKSYQKSRHKASVHFKKIYKCPVAGCITQFIRKDYLVKHTENGRHRYGEGDQMEIERRAQVYESIYGEIDPNKSRPPPGVHIGLWCNICGQTFQHSYQKARHKQKVHEKKKYSCDQCKMVYTRSDGLYKHKKNAHRNKDLKKETSE